MSNTQKKIHALQTIRADVGEEVFRTSLAKIFANHILSMMKDKGRRLNRMELCMRVNLSLVCYGVEELSYGYFRKLM